MNSKTYGNNCIRIQSNIIAPNDIRSKSVKYSVHRHIVCIWPKLSITIVSATHTKKNEHTNELSTMNWKSHHSILLSMNLMKFVDECIHQLNLIAHNQQGFWRCRLIVDIFASIFFSDSHFNSAFHFCWIIHISLDWFCALSCMFAYRNAKTRIDKKKTTSQTLWTINCFQTG